MNRTMMHALANVKINDVLSPNKMHMLQSLFYLTIAVHVLGIIITHLQEHKTTVLLKMGDNDTQSM
jgi:hypothetical protein